MAQNAQRDESTDVYEPLPEVMNVLPADIRQDILDGARDQIPEAVVDGLHQDLAYQVPDSVDDAASSSPSLTAVVVIIGLLAVLGAIWGAVKGFLKVAIGLGLVAAVVWWYFLAGR